MNLREIVDKLSSFRAGELTAKEVETVLNSMSGYIVMPQLLLGKGTLLYRVSLIDSLDEVKKIGRLSYKSATMNNEYGRASTPTNTMFYGVIAATRDEGLVGALEEVCPFLRKNGSLEPRHVLAVLSVWQLKDEINLVQVLNPSGNAKSLAFSNVDEYMKVVAENPFMSQKDKESVLYFQQFLSDEFTRYAVRESDYWISSIYTERFVPEFYLGIIYESVQAVDERLSNIHCVALHPSFVDKSLQFSRAFLYDLDFYNPDQPLDIGLPKELIFSKNGDFIGIK